MPLAYTALDRLPSLRAAVGLVQGRQAARAAACLARFRQRPRLLARLEEALGDGAGGAIVLEGPAGSGVTSVLVALAARAPRPLWLAAEAPDNPSGLYAQLVALHRPAVPLLDPTVTTDPAALERLLAEIAPARGSPPLPLLIDDLDGREGSLGPGPIALPAELPPGVVLLLGARPGVPTSIRPVARLHLPADDPELERVQHEVLAELACPQPWATALLAGSEGNFLYLHLALAMLQAGLLEPGGLPIGLDALLRTWWMGLAPEQRRMAVLLGAAAAPLPLPLLAELVTGDATAVLGEWGQLGLVELTTEGAPSGQEDDTAPLTLAAFSHGALRDLVAREAPAALTAVHGELAARGLELLGREAVTPAERLLRRQLGRHAALGPAERRGERLARTLSRGPLLAHARHKTLDVALDEARWELRAAVGGDELRLARATALAGTLASRARDLDPELAIAALEAGLAHGGREPALKRVLEVVERLPDGHNKALTLRRLGEVCYNNRLRSPAMRLLSRALDLEAAPTSRAWVLSREALFAALASAAVEHGAFDIALAIAGRTEHLERRAQIETLVVRALLARGELARAQRVARDILHESMGAWARAEVGVVLLRHGDARGAMLLHELRLETVAAWAQIELACDDAVRDEAAARHRIASLPTQGQRDRGLARLAHTLAAADNDGAALAAAEAITAVEVRVAALIDLRLALEGLVAMLALERASRDIGGVTGDDRAPLVAALAAALAAIGRGDKAEALARSLPAGEEQDRALARVALGLGQRGDYAAARALLGGIADEDERAWAAEELSRLLAGEGRWDESAALAAIVPAEQRDRTLADLWIARARAGQVRPALALALSLSAAEERARALTLIAPTLVGAGAADEALALASAPSVFISLDARSRYLAAVAVALAEHDHFAAASAVLPQIRRPGDRVRAAAALARRLAAHQPELARAALGEGLRAAAVGREESLRALELAAPALAVLGGPQLLGDVAAAVDEIDRWLD